MTDIAWIYILPAIVVLAFVVGLVWKNAQDKTVEIVRRTLKPGDVHVSDLEKYAAKMHRTV